MAKSKFLKQWLDEKLYPDFVGWLDEVKSQPNSAYCKVCHKVINLSNMARAAIVSHKKGPTHVKNMKAKSKQPSVAIFSGKPKSGIRNSSTIHGSPLPSSSTLHVEEDAHLSEPLAVPVLKQKELQNYCINEEDITSAEIIWAIEIVTGNMSFKSADKNCRAFKRMFYDSKIAHNFAMGKTKASYIINFGLAPFFRNCLSEDVKTCNDYVVCFDESLNKVVQRGQMDLVIRFWDPNFERVATRYWNSVFLGRATADHLLEGFIERLELPLENLLQVSMDGPNVNFSFLNKLTEKIKSDNPDGKLLLDIGVCGLHTLNGAVKSGHSAAGWEIYNVLRALYEIFKNSPARRAKYTEISGSTSFPKKFTSVRWLENGACVDQALKIWDYVGLFIKENPLCGNKSYQCLLEAYKDPLIKAKLASFKCIITECEPFLRRFQSQKPLAPFLYTSLQELVTSLLSRIVKQEKLNEINTVYKLLNLDLSDAGNLISTKAINVGFAAKKFIKDAKCSDSERYQFRVEFRKFIETMIAKLKMKSPLKSHFARGITCFDPKIVLFKPDLGLKRVDIVLEEMHAGRRISAEDAEKSKKQYTQLLSEAQSSHKTHFQEFAQKDCDNTGLDEFYNSIIGTDINFKELWNIMKIVFIISHGNASVESGFSINKNILVDNLSEDSIISQRIVYDAVKSLGGSENVNISRRMLADVRNSRRRYQMCLEKKREMQTEEEKKNKEKKKLEKELKDLEERRRIIELQRLKEDSELNFKRQCLEMKKNTF